MEVEEGFFPKVHRFSVSRVRHTVYDAIHETCVIEVFLVCRITFIFQSCHGSRLILHQYLPRGFNSLIIQKKYNNYPFVSESLHRMYLDFDP